MNKLFSGYRGSSAVMDAGPKPPVAEGAHRSSVGDADLIPVPLRMKEGVGGDKRSGQILGRVAAAGTGSRGRGEGVSAITALA
jgi:hypothetical protein